MDTIQTTNSENAQISAIHRQFISLHTQGKSVREIHEETGFSLSGVRKFINSYTGRTPRTYKRSVLNYATGKPFTSSESIKVRGLKTDNSSLKKELSAEQKKTEKLTKELNNLKRDHRILKSKVEDAEQKVTIIEAENEKNKDEKTRLCTTLHEIKAKGYISEQQKATLINDHLLEIIKAGVELTNPNIPNSIIPVNEVFYKAKSSKHTKK